MELLDPFYHLFIGFANVRRHLGCNLRARYPPRQWNEETQNELHRFFSILESSRAMAESKHNDEGWLFGSFSGADAFYFPVVARLRTYRVEIDPIKFTRAAAYVKKVWVQPLVNEFMLRARKSDFHRPQYDAIYEGMTIE